jgi:putative transposase
MARLPRYFAKGLSQHVMLSGHNRDAIFASDEDRQFIKEAMLEAARRYAQAIHAYVLMSNDVHLRLAPALNGSSPRLMQSLGRRYAQHVKLLLPAHWQSVGEPLQIQPRSG